MKTVKELLGELFLENFLLQEDYEELARENEQFKVVIEEFSKRDKELKAIIRELRMKNDILESNKEEGEDRLGREIETGSEEFYELERELKEQKLKKELEGDDLLLHYKKLQKKLEE